MSTDEYLILRNKISKMINKAKKEMYRNKPEAEPDDPITIWKRFKQSAATEKWNLQKCFQH